LKRACIGCGAIQTASRCPDCQRALRRRQRYDRQAWRKFSAGLRERVGRCQACGSREDLTVDHVAVHSASAGFRVLCRRCHGSLGARTDRAGRDGVGGRAEAVLRPRSLTTGAPSGEKKSVTRRCP
jgi:hypothetical protein